jgi:tRNA(fMet)-specific endonuclease VapC
MIHFLLDTDHVSLQERGHPLLRERISEVLSGTIAISVITMEELIRGRLAVLARRTEGKGRE